MIHGVIRGGLLCAMVLAAAAPRAVLGVERVAVMEMRTTGIEQDVAAVFSEILTAEVASLGTYEVVSSADVKTMLGFEAERQVLGCEDDISCLAEIGGALGVQRLVAGQVGRVGETFVVNLKLINIAQARTERRVYETVSGRIDDVLVTIRTSVRKLFAGMEPPVVATQPPQGPGAQGGSPSAAVSPSAGASSPAINGSLSAAVSPSAGASSPAIDGSPSAAVSPSAVGAVTPRPGAGPAVRSGGVGAAPIILWALGAVGVGGGVFFGLDAQDKHEGAWAAVDDPGVPVDGATRGLIDDGERSMLFANIGYAAGGAALVAGTVLWLLGDASDGTARTVGSDQGPALTIAPMPTAGGGGFAATLRF